MKIKMLPLLGTNKFNLKGTIRNKNMSFRFFGPKEEKGVFSGGIYSGL